MGEAKSWCVSENEYLVKAWLDVSQDPITGTSLKDEQFWTRVLDVYNLKKANDGRCSEDRNWASLKQTLQLMQHDMKKFHNLYKSLKRNIKSGYNEQQYRDLALSKWATILFSKGSAFQYETCWMIVKDSPKWHSFNEMVEKKKTSISPSSTNAVQTLRRISAPNPSSKMENPLKGHLETKLQKPASEKLLMNCK
jgi:hypothetical protein